MNFNKNVIYKKGYTKMPIKNNVYKKAKIKDNFLVSKLYLTFIFAY